MNTHAVTREVIINSCYLMSVSVGEEKEHLLRALVKICHEAPTKVFSIILAELLDSEEDSVDQPTLANLVKMALVVATKFPSAAVSFQKRAVERILERAPSTLAEATLYTTMLQSSQYGALKVPGYVAKLEQYQQARQLATQRDHERRWKKRNVVAPLAEPVRTPASEPSPRKKRRFAGVKKISLDKR